MLHYRITRVSVKKDILEKIVKTRLTNAKSTITHVTEANVKTYWTITNAIVKVPGSKASSVRMISTNAMKIGHAKMETVTT